MRNHPMLGMTVLTALLLLSGITFAQSKTHSGDEQQLLARVHLFGEAWLKADVKTLDSLLAREYTHTDVTGKVLNRAKWLADAGNAQNWLRAPQGSTHPAISFDDVKVKFLGDTAVITGGNTIRSARAEEKPIVLRFTQVWIREDGEWKRTFFQATEVKN